MLSSLQIQNFRGLKDVKINSLGRVNLIVGENNAGKSSVLEALRIYAGRAEQHILDEIAIEHNEPILDNNDNAMSYTKPYASFFYGRNYPLDYEQNIVIGEVNGDNLIVKHSVELSITETIQKINGSFELSKTYQRLPKDILSSKQRKGVDEVIRVEFRGRLIDRISLNGKQDDFYHREFEDEYRNINFKYIPTSFLELNYLAKIWDTIALTSYENVIIDALKIIEKDVEDLGFISFNRNPFFDRMDRVPIVKLKSFDEPIPLNSMGDGMKRILQLILNLHQAKDGLLLIDEFDNGLHYKVQEKVWGLLFELAERFNVQVFATTHSNDCIRAFSKISQERTDIDGMLIQMTKEHYKDGTSQIVANVVDENQLQRLLNLGVDVR